MCSVLGVVPGAAPHNGMQRMFHVLINWLMQFAAPWEGSS